MKAEQDKKDVPRRETKASRGYARGGMGGS